MVGVLIRKYGPKQTAGHFVLLNGTKRLLELKTVERPWCDNDPNVSCIPEGVYYARQHTSPTFGKCFSIPDVPARSDILIHPANFVSDLQGCIAAGRSFIDINGDGLNDVTQSRNAIAELLSLTKSFKLIVTS